MSGSSGRDTWDDAEVWTRARARAREEVRAAFAPSARVCPSCGSEEVTASRLCPRCGASYVELQDPGMSRAARRRLAIGAALALVVLVAAAIAIVPAVQSSKRTAEARARAQAQATFAAERRRIAVDQRLHTAAAPGSRAALRRLAPAALTARLRRGLEAAILADALARVRAHTLQGPILRVRCAPSGGAAGPPLGRYVCDAVNGEIVRGSRVPVGSIGYPFWARIDFRRLVFHWCKVNPKAGEGSATPAATVLSVPLPRACDIGA